VKALLFGARPDPGEPRPVPTDELEERLASLPFGLHEMDDAHPIHPDWGGDPTHPVRCVRI
jgi:hypothetical protein